MSSRFFLGTWTTTAYFIHGPKCWLLCGGFAPIHGLNESPNQS